jgi:hypothetical protein
MGIFTRIAAMDRCDVEVLKNVENFSAPNSNPLPDTQFEKADQKLL